MIPVRLDEIRALDLGSIGGEPTDGVITRIHADSRDARRGDLFVALNSGVDYVDDARARGAVTLVPYDQHAALAALARMVRSRSDARVVAVVGSTGKTSTKDALGALCSAVTPTVYAQASHNNEIGLPLTVLRLEPDTRILVTELGMRGLGEIASLCEIARPDLTLVTAIGPEHLELVGTVENAARANAEAIEALPPGGVAVVPADAHELGPYLREDLDVRRFDRAGVTREEERWSFEVGGVRVALSLPFPQRHMAENVLAALTAYDALGLPLDRAQEGAAAIALSPWRGETIELPGGGFVVNDAYNANPTSMRAALVDLTERAHGRRRVAILGEMAELGDSAAAYHAEIGSLVAELGIECVAAVGPLALAYLPTDGAQTVWVARRDDLRLDEIVGPGDAVLVKASRAGGLEGIPATLANIAGAWSAS